MSPFQLPKYVYSSEHLLGILTQLREIECPPWLDETNELMRYKPQKSLLLTSDEGSTKSHTHHNNNNQTSKFKQPTSNNFHVSGGNHTSNMVSRGVDDSARIKSKRWNPLEFRTPLEYDIETESSEEEESYIVSLKEKAKGCRSLDEQCVADMATASIIKNNGHADVVAFAPSSDDYYIAAYSSNGIDGKINADKNTSVSSKNTLDESTEEQKLSAESLPLKNNELPKNISNGNGIADNMSQNLTITEPRKSASAKTSPNYAPNRKPYVKSDQIKDENLHFNNKAIRGKPSPDHKNKGSTHLNKNANTPSSNSNNRVYPHKKYEHGSSTTTTTTTTNNNNNKKNTTQQQNLLSTKNKSATTRQSRPKSLHDRTRDYAPLITNQSIDLHQNVANNVANNGANNVANNVANNGANNGANNVANNVANNGANNNANNNANNESTVDRLIQECLVNNQAKESQPPLMKPQLNDTIEKNASWFGMTTTANNEGLTIEQIELEERAKNLRNGKSLTTSGNASANRKDNNPPANPEENFWDSAMKFF